MCQPHEGFPYLSISQTSSFKSWKLFQRKISSLKRFEVLKILTPSLPTSVSFLQRSRATGICLFALISLNMYLAEAPLKVLSGAYGNGDV